MHRSFSAKKLWDATSWHSLALKNNHFRRANANMALIQNLEINNFRSSGRMARRASIPLERPRSLQCAMVNMSFGHRDFVYTSLHRNPFAPETIFLDSESKYPSKLGKCSSVCPWSPIDLKMRYLSKPAHFARSPLNKSWRTSGTDPYAKAVVVELQPPMLDVVKDEKMNQRSSSFQL